MKTTNNINVQMDSIHPELGHPPFLASCLLFNKLTELAEEAPAGARFVATYIKTRIGSGTVWIADAVHGGMAESFPISPDADDEKSRILLTLTKALSWAITTDGLPLTVVEETSHDPRILCSRWVTGNPTHEYGTTRHRSPRPPKTCPLCSPDSPRHPRHDITRDLNYIVKKLPSLSKQIGF